MRVLFTTPILEHPPAGGPQLRIENSIKALSRVCSLDIMHRIPGPSATLDATVQFYSQFADEYVTVYGKSSGSSSWFQAQWQRIKRRLYDDTLESFTNQILDHVQRRNIEVVWFGYGNISYPLIRRIKARKPSLKLVCDTDSVWSRFILREIPYAKPLRKISIYCSGFKKRLEERAWVKLCNVTTAVSKIDAEYYSSLDCDPGRVWIFSNVIDVVSYTSSYASPPEFKKPSIYLAGTFGHYHSPMDMAARWVLEEVLPLVLRIQPDLHFYIVGRNSDQGFGHLRDPNVTVTGQLESVLPYLKNASVAIVPLKYESGTRFKILEAGACKIPLVSTTLGAEGIPVKHGENILIADTPQEFANAIVLLLTDEDMASRLAHNCEDMVKQQFSVESLADEAAKILSYLKAPGRA
jgi:glycosyltransferase involved in cell wall biosynthesis